MSNYKPVGKELKLAKQISILINRFRKLNTENTPHSACIDIGHTLDGVRTNGYEKVVGLYDVRKSIREYSNSVKHEVAELKKSLKLSDLIMRKLGVFRICPSCKGGKGHWNVPDNTWHRRYWSDCGKCDGRGILF